MTQHQCEECVKYCVQCEDFESMIETINDTTLLKKIRLELSSHKTIPDDKISGKIADWIVDKVGTMTFFFFCILMVTIPIILPITMPVIQYISSGYLQLILLPLIVVAGNRADKVRELRQQREYRMLLVSDRIDELMEG